MVEEIAERGLDRNQVAKEFGCTVGVREATFTVKEGEVFVVMGLSGSGKSTLIRCLNRLFEPTAGQIIIDGEDLTAMDYKQLRHVRQTKMGMVFQHFALLPHRTVLDNVAFGLELQKLSKTERYKRAQEALELVGLEGWEDKHPRELSGGMQQRVGLARALTVNPEILLMDEAFSALDPLIRTQMQDEFLKLVAIVKKTIVFITHDLDEALKLADRIAVMKDGLIVQIGTPEEIVMHPADEYVAEFVGSISRTKVVSAKDLMVEPEVWISAGDDDPIAVLNKMRKHNLNHIFITDSTNRLVGVVSRHRLASPQPEGAKNLAQMAEKGYPSVPADASLEGVLSTAAKSKTPLVVLDDNHQPIGIIPHRNLLESLVEIV